MHSDEELGEYIGVESCTDFTPDVAAIVASRGGAGMHRRRFIRRSGDDAVAEYPPPLPLLARTENLQPNMPWVMKKHCTSDGRLVITEEKARRHEYFQVHRSDGRLVLNLVPVNVDSVEEEEEEADQEKLGFVVPGNVADSGEKMDKRNGDPPPPEEVYVGVEPCGGFGVAMGGLIPPVHS